MTPATKRLGLAVDHLKEAGINDALIVFEAQDESGEVSPYLIRIGSPMACLALASYASDYLESIRNAKIYTEEDEDD